MKPTRINQSALKWYKRSPAHYLYNLNNPAPSTDAQVFGSAYHCYILEKSVFNERYFVFDPSGRPNPDKDFRDTENKKWKSQQFADNDTKQPLNIDDFNNIVAMSNVLTANGTISKLLYSGIIESHIELEDFKGCPVHLRPDFYNDNVIIDLKTTGNASEKSFSKDSANYGYHIQAAFYTDAMAQMDGKERTFIIIAQEYIAPYCASVFVVSEQMLTQGRWEVEKLMKQHISCCEAEQWPGYEPQDGTGVFELYLPAWAIGE